MNRLRRFTSLFSALEFGRPLASAPRRAKKKRSRALSFELCESREMLDGATITGTKVETVNSSGFSPGDTPMSGVTIDLFQDDGDNSFDPNVDTLFAQSVTGVNGGYEFDTVPDGHYYIREEVPTGFVQSAGPAFYTVDVVNGQTYTGGSTLVDNFLDPDPEQDFQIDDPGPNPFLLTTFGTGMIGGMRDLTVNVPGSTIPNSLTGSIGNFSGQGSLTISSGPDGLGAQVTTFYDADGSGLAADLTAGGANGLRFDFGFLQVGTGTTMDAQIILNGPSGSDTFNGTITENGGAFSFFVQYSSFVPAGSFSLTNVSSIEVDLNQSAVSAVDFQLNQIIAVGQQNTSYNFGNFPIPTTLSSLSGNVYADTNNNGTFDVNEPPIAGVIVTLTGTDDHGAPVSLSTTTNSLGAYTFTNLRPGTYTLTETQPINFIDGKDTIGTPGGTTGNDIFTNIQLPAGFDGVNNNFGELGLTPAYATKRSLLFPSQPVNLVAVNNGTTGGGGNQGAAATPAKVTTSNSHVTTTSTASTATSHVTTSPTASASHATTSTATAHTATAKTTTTSEAKTSTTATPKTTTTSTAKPAVTTAKVTTSTAKPASTSIKPAAVTTSTSAATHKVTTTAKVTNTLATTPTTAKPVTTKPATQPSEPFTVTVSARSFISAGKPRR